MQNDIIDPEFDVVAFLQILIRGIVDRSDEVTIIPAREGPRTTVLQVKVHPDDLGKIIGQRGSVAQCIRTIVSSMGRKYDYRFQVDIVKTDA